jgi:D-amino-acid oxidase
VVIGAGVSGLTTALVLARRDWRVTVVADRFDRDVVSTVAGALWEWPPSVCGRHHAEPLLARSAEWTMVSFRHPVAPAPRCFMQGVSQRLAKHASVSLTAVCAYAAVLSGRPQLNPRRPWAR